MQRLRSVGKKVGVEDTGKGKQILFIQIELTFHCCSSPTGLALLQKHPPEQKESNPGLFRSVKSSGRSNEQGAEYIQSRQFLCFYEP